MNTDPYAPVIDGLRSSGIRAEFHRPHQLALPRRVWISWAEQWYISTWTPAHYPVPEDQDVVALCQACLAWEENDGFYTIPDNICRQFNLGRISSEEFDAAFGDDESTEE